MIDKPSSSSTATDKQRLDLPLRLFTALRTIRLYPPTNPQVQRSNDFVFAAVYTFLADADSVIIGYLGLQILVDGTPLPDKEQARPQIKGLAGLLGKLELNSITFHSGLSKDECNRFITFFSDFLAEKQADQSVKELFKEASFEAISLDEKRYVVVGEGEQVVHEDEIGAGLNISDEELANFVLGESDPDQIQSVSKGLVEELLNRLPPGDGGERPEGLADAVVDVLQKISNETDHQKRSESVNASAATLASLDPSVLSGLMSLLPETDVTDEMLTSTVEKLDPTQLNNLITNMVIKLSSQVEASGEGDGGATAPQAMLRKLAGSTSNPEVKRSIAQNIDAKQLLQVAGSSGVELPENLLNRLQKPEWSAPVLANAMQQAIVPQLEQGGEVDLTAFNQMLDRYEHLLDNEKQTQVVQMAGEQLASMQGLALGKVLSHKFKGVLGEQLYGQMLSQIPDAQLEETVEQLEPDQLSTMVSALTSKVNLGAGTAGLESILAGDPTLQRLASTSKGEQVKQTVEQNITAHQLLQDPKTTLDELPPHLLQRLNQPEWSAPVITNAIEQALGKGDGESGDLSVLNDILPHYEQLLSKEKQMQVAELAGEKLASIEGLALGNILSTRFKGLLGEQLYNQLLYRMSDQQLDESLDQLNEQQVDHLIASVTSNIPLYVDQEGAAELTPADDDMLKRLATAAKNPQVKQSVDQHIDARRLLHSPEEGIAGLPVPLQDRLSQPEWSAPVLANAVEHALGEQVRGHGSVDLAALNSILPHYEELLSKEKQLQVAELAGEKLASMEGLAMGNLLATRFKGVLGEQLYNNILYRMSDQELDETIDQLNTKQIDRLVSAVTSSAPLQVDEDGSAQLAPTDEKILQRLSKTSKGEQVRTAVDQQVDARQLLHDPDTRISDLPPHLQLRLQQPEWSAPVLANAIEHAIDAQGDGDGAVDLSKLNKILPHYEELLSKEKQLQVAELAGEKLASIEGLALGNLLSTRLKGILGEQLYNQILYKMSDQQLDETIDQLDANQIDHLVETVTSKIPLKVDTDGSAELAAGDDAILQRLTATGKGGQITTSVKQHVDARQLLKLNEVVHADLPSSLQERLQQPQWSAPVLANAVKHAISERVDGKGPVDLSELNKILPHYEELLDKGKQLQVAEIAGEKLASIQGLALGNILATRFKGMLGEQLYNKVLYRMTDTQLDESIDQLDDKQLDRLVSAVSKQLPLSTGESEGELSSEAVSDPMVQRLTATTKGEQIRKSVDMHIDARHLLEHPKTRITDLPANVAQRLQEPEWSAPVLATIIEQITDPDQQNTAGSADALNEILPHYEQLLSKEKQMQVAELAGERLASMEGLALGNVLSHRFKGILGEELYNKVLTKVTDEQLDETVDHLDAKRLDRLVASLTSDISLQLVKSGSSDFTPADDSILKRLTKTNKGPEVQQTIAQSIDAQVLQATDDQLPTVPDKLLKRLQQPAWSAPVLVKGMKQIIDRHAEEGKPVDPETFNRMLTHYEELLSQDKQHQVVAQAGAQLASLEEGDLGQVLVQRFKGMFGEKLYGQVINQISDEKFEKIAVQMQQLSTGETDLDNDAIDQDVEEAYNRLMKTVRGEKMRAVIEMHRKKKSQKEKDEKTVIREGIDALLQGDQKVLATKPVRRVLPETIDSMLTNNEETSADSLLMHLALALQHGDSTMRGHAASTLAATAEALAKSGYWIRLGRLRPALEEAILLEESDEKTTEQAINAICKLAEHYLKSGNYDQADEAIQTIRRLRDVDLDSEAGKHRRLAAQNGLDTICKKPLLKSLLETYLHSETDTEQAGRLLTALDKQSARFQLQQLMKNESRFERKKLLELIKQTGKPAREVLVEQLEKISPWYVTRNIIRLLGEIGTEETFAFLSPYIKNNDLRIQHEVLNSAGKIGGEQCRYFLANTLQTIDNNMKIRVVAQMINEPDERYIKPLTDLLDGTMPYQGKNKEALQLTICRALGKIGSRRALATLKKVIQGKKVLGGYSEQVRTTAQQASQQIKHTAAQLRKEQPREIEPVASPEKKPLVEKQEDTTPKSSLKDEETKIFLLAENGKKEEAKEALFDLITATARGGDFENAERLRERIYEIDPMALTEIIRAGEIIEQEKQGAIREDDLQIWSSLVDQLTAEEFQTIYHELRERSYKPEETIVSQGDKSNELFFVNQGSIKVSHLINNREIFITSLNRGQIAGENFFHPSIWTVTLSSLTPSRVSVLKQENLNDWEEQHPGLRSKLQSFYQSCNNVHAMLEKKGLDRREEERFKLSRKVQVQPTDNTGNPIGRGFRAEIADISLGGLAFIIRIAKKENARLLLGRSMQVVLPVGGSTKLMHLKGMAIGIQPANPLENDYSVHFKFDKKLDKGALQGILG